MDRGACRLYSPKDRKESDKTKPMLTLDFSSLNPKMEVISGGCQESSREKPRKAWSPRLAHCRARETPDLPSLLSHSWKPPWCDGNAFVTVRY